MINKEDCHLLGKIRKSTGFSGEVIITALHDLHEEILSMRFMHIAIQGDLIPFFIHDIEILSSRSLKISFLDATTQDMARKLVDCEVYLEKNQLPAMERPGLHATVKGFLVTDKKAGDIGRVVEVLENPGQDLLVIQSGNREILVPVAEELIQGVDMNKKILSVDLPEGLIDLNI